MDNQEIIWKPYPKDTAYWISNQGEIISFTRGKRAIHISQRFDKDGYRMISMRPNTTRRVHRLLAETFIPNPDGKPVINHINGIKDDNRLENLEWATISENTQHSYDMGLQVSPARSRVKIYFGNELYSVFNSLTQLEEHCGVNRNNLTKIADEGELLFDKWELKTCKNEEINYPTHLQNNPIVKRTFKRYDSTPLFYNQQFYENATVFAELLGVSRNRVVNCVKNKKELFGCIPQPAMRWMFTES